MESIATAAVGLPGALGRYELLGVLGRGGMANVYLGRHEGGSGFQRLVAIKVLHPHLAEEEAFVEMLLDEARIAARLHHPNVVPIVDLGTQDGIHYVVMEYVEGCALSVLLKKYRDRRPPRLLVPIILDALSGLHAAHSLTDDDGQPLRLVHRDVSPQNILVGVDGMARLTDFGIAKAESRINSTRPGELKGKISFMSPEQIKNPEAVDHRSDVFSAGVLLWTSLTGRQLFEGDSTGAAMNNTLRMAIEPPSQIGLKPPAIFDAICLRALERNVDARLASALGFEESLRSAATANGLCGSRREVGEWVRAAVGEELTERRNATRSSGSQRIARRMHSPAGGTGAVSDWNPSMVSVVSEVGPSSEPNSVTPSPNSSTQPSTPVLDSAPISVLELETATDRRKRWLLIGLGFVLVAGLAWTAGYLKIAPSSAPRMASAISKPPPVSRAAPLAAPVTPFTQLAPATGKQAATAQAAPPAPEAPRVESARRRAAPVPPRHGTATSTQPAAVAIPAQESGNAPGEPRPKKPVWDEDSPLPHP